MQRRACIFSHAGTGARQGCAARGHAGAASTARSARVAGPVWQLIYGYFLRTGSTAGVRFAGSEVTCLGTAHIVQMTRALANMIACTATLPCIAGQQRRWDVVRSHSSLGIVLYHTELRAALIVRQFRPAVRRPPSHLVLAPAGTSTWMRQRNRAQRALAHCAVHTMPWYKTGRLVD